MTCEAEVSHGASLVRGQRVAKEEPDIRLCLPPQRQPKKTRNQPFANTGRANAHQRRSGAAGKEDPQRLRRRSCAEDKRRVLLACISTLDEYLCAFALRLPGDDDEVRR